MATIEELEAELRKEKAKNEREREMREVAQKRAKLEAELYQLRNQKKIRMVNTIKGKVSSVAATVGKTIVRVGDRFANKSHGQRLTQPNKSYKAMARNVLGAGAKRSQVRRLARQLKRQDMRSLRSNAGSKQIPRRQMPDFRKVNDDMYSFSKMRLS